MGSNYLRNHRSTPDSPSALPLSDVDQEVVTKARNFSQQEDIWGSRGGISNEVRERLNSLVTRCETAAIPMGRKVASENLYNLVSKIERHLKSVASSQETDAQGQETAAEDPNRRITREEVLEAWKVIRQFPKDTKWIGDWCIWGNKMRKTENGAWISWEFCAEFPDELYVIEYIDSNEKPIKPANFSHLLVLRGIRDTLIKIGQPE